VGCENAPPKSQYNYLGNTPFLVKWKWISKSYTETQKPTERKNKEKVKIERKQLCLKGRRELIPG